MKRSSMSPFNYNPGKRFDSRAPSPQICTPSQLQHQPPQQWQQYPHARTQYFSTPPPGYNNPRIPFADNNFETVASPVSPYLSNCSGAGPAAELMAHTWDFSIPPPPTGILPVLPPFSDHINTSNLSRMPSTQRLPIPITPQTNTARLRGQQLSANSQPLGQQSLHVATLATDTPSQEASQTPISKKEKKQQQQNAAPSITWTREEAIKAIALEDEFSRKQGIAHTLILNFPDPYLNHDIVKGFSPDIETVYFQFNSAPRHCLVHLREGVDYEKTIEAISKIPFGTGFISAFLKPAPSFMLEPSNPDDVDPTRLYIGNLPPKMTSAAVKMFFPGFKRVDIGHAHRLKFTRYAIIRYDCAEKAMEAYKQSVNTLIESRSIIVRFYRNNSYLASGKYNSINEATHANSLEEREPNPGDVNKAPERTLAISRNSTTPIPQNNTCEDSGGDSDLSSLIEEPETIETDSKTNVFDEAAKLKQTMQSSQQRRSSLEEEMRESDRQEASALATSKTTEQNNLPAPPIKEEKSNSDDDLSEDDDEPSNLLGLRYQENAEDTQVKSEPEDEPTGNRTNKNNACDDDFDSELEEEDDDHWTGILAPRNDALKNSQSSTTNKSIPNLSHTNALEVLRQQELSVTEKKPDINELTDPATTTTRDLIEHKKFVEYLNKQVNDFEKENGRSQADELDDLFDQMNSDSEQDDL